MSETFHLAELYFPYFSAAFALLTGMKVLRASRIKVPPAPETDQQVTADKITQMLAYMDTTSHVNKRAAIYAMISAAFAIAAWMISTGSLQKIFHLS